MAKPKIPVYNLLHVAKEDKRSEDLQVERFASYLEKHYQQLHLPHRHTFYHLVLFTKGSGSHTIDFASFNVKPFQVYFMIPGQVHDWNFKTKPDGFIVNFSEQYINELITNTRYLDQFPFFSGIANEQVITIPEEDRRQVEQILETVVREGNSTNELKDDYARTALVQLFIQVNRYVSKADGKQQNSYNSVLLRNFQKLIDQHYKEMKLTREYAAMLYVTPNHLNALSKDVTGRSAGELIRDRILLEAKRLLVNAKMTISEIALELDFADNSYFSKFFKKYEGVTPEVFRKQIIKKLKYGNDNASSGKRS